MPRFSPCMDPPTLSAEDGRVSPSSVLLDSTAYMSADAVTNATTAVGRMSSGNSVHVSLCFARAPRLSYLCVHFPGPAKGPAVGTAIGPPAGTAAARCVRCPPRVIATHADLALLRVPIPGARNSKGHDLFVYTAHPQPGASSLELLPKPPQDFPNADAAILRCPGSPHRYVVACLLIIPGTEFHKHYNLCLYDSDTGGWSTRLLRVDSPDRDVVLPIPLTATEVLFHNTTKTMVLGGPKGTIGWVDLWRGILYCDVLDDMPVLRDMPLPKPARRNKKYFCVGNPHYLRDITTVAVGEDQQVIKYVEMEFRPGDVPPSPRNPRHNSTGSEEYTDSDDDEEEEAVEAVADYWKATIWTMPVPFSSWKDWRKDCTLDVTDIVVDNRRHSELLLPLPRHTADPVDAKWSLRRLNMGHPTLGLGMDGGEVIYLLSKVNVMEDRGWVIAVNTRSGKLNGVAELDHRKNKLFRCYYVPSEISKYLTNATGVSGRLVKALQRRRK